MVYNINIYLLLNLRSKRKYNIIFNESWIEYYKNIII